jgi:hypothetical protein
MAADEPKTIPISTTEVESDSRGTSDGDESDKEQRLAPAAGKSTFHSVEDHRFYKPIDSYEGLHRWDPHFEWTPEEEKRIVRKVSGPIQAYSVTRS